MFVYDDNPHTYEKLSSDLIEKLKEKNNEGDVSVIIKPEGLLVHEFQVDLEGSLYHEEVQSNQVELFFSLYRAIKQFEREEGLIRRPGKDTLERTRRGYILADRIRNKIDGKFKKFQEWYEEFESTGEITEPEQTQLTGVQITKLTLTDFLTRGYRSEQYGTIATELYEIMKDYSHSDIDKEIKSKHSSFSFQMWGEHTIDLECVESTNSRYPKLTISFLDAPLYLGPRMFKGLLDEVVEQMLDAREQTKKR